PQCLVPVVEVYDLHPERAICVDLGQVERIECIGDRVGDDDVESVADGRDESVDQRHVERSAEGGVTIYDELVECGLAGPANLDVDRARLERQITIDGYPA